MPGLTQGRAPFGLILVGGQARRMGGADKAGLALGGETILSHIMRVVAPQCAALALSTRGDAGRWRDYGLPAIPDHQMDSEGPIAGILAGLVELERHGPDCDMLLSVPGDTPFLPRDLVARLATCRTVSCPIACAASGGRDHPAVALWPLSIRPLLAEAFAGRGIRSIRTFQAEVGVATASWHVTGPDPFFNVNTASDLAEAEQWLARPSES